MGSSDSPKLQIGVGPSPRSKLGIFGSFLPAIHQESPRIEREASQSSLHRFTAQRSHIVRIDSKRRISPELPLIDEKMLGKEFNDRQKRPRPSRYQSIDIRSKLIRQNSSKEELIPTFYQDREPPVHNAKELLLRRHYQTLKKSKMGRYDGPANDIGTPEKHSAMQLRMDNGSGGLGLPRDESRQFLLGAKGRFDQYSVLN